MNVYQAFKNFKDLENFKNFQTFQLLCWVETHSVEAVTKITPHKNTEQLQSLSKHPKTQIQRNWSGDVHSCIFITEKLNYTFA